MNATSTRAPLSVVVLTFNEGRNLAACLESVADCAAEIFVVDSGSTDATARIAEQAGATVVVHPFETHAKQWAWALQALPIRSDWVLALDADQRATPELAHAIVAELNGSGSAGRAGYFIPRRQIFRGRWIRHGGYYPKYLLKLFRREAVSLDDTDLVDHHFRVKGEVGTLHADLIEDNRNEAAIFDWIAKHNRYARLQAMEEIQLQRGASQGRLLGSPDERTARLKSVWRRLPLYGRPIAYFLYRYILRLGFLDGKEGFVFHVLQAFWYRLLVDINVDEQRRAAAGLPAAVIDVETAGDERPAR